MHHAHSWCDLKLPAAAAYAHLGAVVPQSQHAIGDGPHRCLHVAKPSRPTVRDNVAGRAPASRTRPKTQPPWVRVKPFAASQLEQVDLTPRNVELVKQLHK